MVVLPNDGISSAGKQLLEQHGFKVIDAKIAQEQLANFINEQRVEVLLVRSATQVRKELIDACSNLKIIGRGGVGMDNIDVSYAKDKGIQVINTPAASSRSVAELVFAHFLTIIRFLHDANRKMPLEGDTKFNELKKSYAKATELKGKTLGIIGFGRIGQEVAKLGISMGMKVMFCDHHNQPTTLTLEFFDGQKLNFNLLPSTFEELLYASDFISIHVPKQPKYVLGREEFQKLKQGCVIVNTARGGVIDEVALVDAIHKGIVRGAGLDVFENEPSPELGLLMNEHLSLSPHVGGNTIEAQERIGLELAEQIIAFYKK